MMSNYKDYGILIDCKYCDNCGSCVVACQEEKDLSADQSGIIVLEKGPFKKENDTLDDVWDWDYIPVPTDRCDLCAKRLNVGKKPMCVKHCMTFCMDYGPVDELAQKAKTLGEKVMIYKIK